MNTNDRSLAFVPGHDRLVPAIADPRFELDPYLIRREEQSAAIELRALWSALYRNRFLMLVIVGLALAGGIVSIMLTTPVYRARASIQIDQQSSKILGTEDVEPNQSSQEADRFLQTQVDVLRSRVLAGRVAQSLQLFGNASFLEAMGQEPPATDQSPQRKRDKVIGLLQGNLEVYLPRNSRVVEITFDSQNPSTAARVANSYSDNFIQANLQRRFDTSTYSREFLQNQLNLTKTKLEQSERALIDYARSARLIDASAGTTGASDSAGPKSLTTSNLVEINQAYAAARSARVQAQQRWQQAQVTPVMSLPEVLGNPTIQQLVQRRAEQQAAYEQELQRRQAEHPAVKQAAAQLAELDRQIKTLAASIRASIRDQYLVAQRQEGALQGNVGQLKTETLSEQDRGIRYNILKREVDTNRQLYDGLLQRYKEVSAQAGITSNNISIIDRAEPPLGPISPRPLLNMSLAGMGGLALALLVVFAREKFDDVIRGPDDVDSKLGLPILGVVPLLKSGLTPQKALMNPRSAISEAHYALRSSLELSTGEGVPTSLLLTSTRQSEGKSTTSYAVARDFAASGRRVLLVDADLRKPSLHRLLGLANGLGLSNLLARQKPMEEVIQVTDMPGLDFLASGPLPPNPAHLLGSASLGQILATLSERYDLVVIDGPPILGLADAPRLSAAAEGTIFVVEANDAHFGSAKGALKRLLDSRANVIGAVLTKFDAKKIGYGSDYGYYSYEYYSEEVENQGSERPSLSSPRQEDA
jgi:capsular exopolysaccharide synthesis family protein